MFYKSKLKVIFASTVAVLTITACGGGNDTSTATTTTTTTTTTMGPPPLGTTGKEFIETGDLFLSQWCGDRYVTAAILKEEADWGHWKKFPNLLKKDEFLAYAQKWTSDPEVTLCAISNYQYWTTDNNGGRHVCNFDLGAYKWQCDDWTVNTDTTQRHSAIVWCVPGHECKDAGDYEKYGGQ